ncbi:hypothetical protein [Actinoplanes sp. NPDC049802]|uniref:hypothetical protein n=1 Tax=Actinoplanes sp. NPDC049802 TaxID=3154742 RepID=UPI003409E6FC
MAGRASLVATIESPIDRDLADYPEVLHWPGRRLLVHRGDAEVVTRDIRLPNADSLPEVRFPAPWPRGIGKVSVAPDQNAMVFAGVHAVRLVGADGATVWELRHGCWAEQCAEFHESFAEYAGDRAHTRANRGSAAFSADGSLVWAHVRGPLADVPATESGQELWVLLEAATGRILGHAPTQTYASGSQHTVFPDPARMALSVAEGEEDSPVFHGRWDGRELTVEQLDIDLKLLDVSPSGRFLMTVTSGQEFIILYDAEDGAELREIEVEPSVPPHPDSTDEDDRRLWDYEGAFVDDDIVIAGTTESDLEFGDSRHWLIDTRDMSLLAEASYPLPIDGPPRPAGDGTWYTVSWDGTAVLLWSLTAE